MPEITIRLHEITHSLLEHDDLGKTLVLLAVPHDRVVDNDAEHSPVPGTSATSPRAVPKVFSISCAIHPARSSHLHCVQ